MYTLTAFALGYRLTRDPALKRTIDQLVTIELGADHQSKEVIILAPGAVGTVNPDRSNYTWNALIVPALKWAGVCNIAGVTIIMVDSDKNTLSPKGRKVIESHGSK